MAIFQVDLVSWYQNVSIVDYLELRVMEVVVTNEAVRCAKLMLYHHLQHTSNQHFYRPDALPIAIYLLLYTLVIKLISLK